jgi:outer membrane receptor protein involved in Fe transport
MLFAAAAIGALALQGQPSAARAAPAEAGLMVFDIASGPLDAALVAYANQAGRQILFDPALVKGLRAPAVKGRFAPGEALDWLLRGTGLVVQQTSANAFLIRAAGGPATTAPSARAAEVFPISTGAAGDAAPALASAANADPAPELLEELVVTGTLIRGGSPASPVVRLDRDELDARGHATVADMVAALPQNFGGAGSPDAALAGTDGRNTNDLAATGINLRGLGASATLVLVNGRRMGGVGSKGDFADASAIPTAVVERVDVLLDGASALYGSDAVGGVVNVLLKRNLLDPETRLRIGAAAGGGGEEVQASHALGHAWTSGDLVLAYEYGRRWGLRNSERAFTATADLRALGGTDHRTFYSHPGNILVFNAATASYQAAWAIPAGQNGMGLRPSDFIAGAANLGNGRQGGDVLPKDERHNLYASLSQDLGPRIRLLADARYNIRENLIRRPAPVSVFSVSRANPFFVSPNGSSSHVIGYSFADEIGPSVSDGTAESLGLSAGLEIDLPRDWRADIYAASALEIGARDTRRLVNSRFLNEAVGAIADDPLTAWSTTRDGWFNPFGDGGANGPAVLAFIGSGYTLSRTQSTVATFDAKADGPLFALPAGPLKAAFGVQLRHERFKPETWSLVSTAAPVQAGGETFTRRVEAAFLELRAPLVDTAMGAPFIHGLEASLAGRIERYGDFGQTANPKIGLLWTPVPALRLRASYGTSFRSPNMPELYQLENASPVLIGSGANQTLALVRTGGNRSLEPEHATTWSFGFDYSPETLPGLEVSATWFDVRFADQIGQPVASDIRNALSNPAYAAFIERLDGSDPAAIARVRAIMALSTSSNIGLFPAEAYRAIVDGRFVNTGEVRVRGLDASARYGWDRGADRFDLEAQASWLADYVRTFTPTASPVQLVDQAGQPVDLRLRLSGSWGRGPFGARATLTYVDDYRSETGEAIEAWTPVDLQLRWTPAEADGPLAGLSLILNLQNAFDEDPPFYDSPFGVGYDPANADPLGRYLSLQLTKRW